MLKQNTLKNIKAIVTGGSSGIGGSIVRGLVEAGAEVNIISRREPNLWGSTILSSSSWSLEKNWIQADLCNINETSQKLDFWLNQHNRQINVFIHSAVNYGSNSRRPLTSIGLNTWEEVFTVGTHSYFAIIKIILPHLLKHSPGLILEISSELAFNPGPGRLDYAASKAASRSLSLGLSEEVEGTNISVVGLLPKDVIDTPGIRNRRPQNTDFTQYLSSDIFIKPALTIIRNFGMGMNGKCFVVSDNGELLLATKDNLVSKSRKEDVGIYK